MTMLKYLKLCCLLCAFGFMVSCNSDYNSEYVKSVDSLLVKSDSMVKQFSYFHIDTLNAEFEHIKDCEKAFQSQSVSFYEDSVVKRSLMILGKIHKSYKNFIKNYSNLLSATEYSVKQLSDLKRDVENNMLKNDEFKTYFDQENEALKNLSINVSFYYNDMINAKELYLHEVSAIDSIIKLQINK